jgi:formylglycine-generating enzyme required for sulfatase activity
MRLHEEQRRKAETSGPPTFERYELRERLGEGAAAVVWRATDKELGREVAIKILKDSLGANADVRERFRHEAQVAAKLSHPGLVTLYDAGEVDGRLYIVMELVIGRPLSALFAERRLEPPALVALLEKAALGIGAAHALGIVHRDLKPDNVLVTAAGEPKVGDFGLAHVVGAKLGMTRAGAVMGTPLYMAPEQVAAKAEAISPRTDVYALGAMLYEILTGRPPFTGQSLTAIYLKITGEEPARPRTLNRGAERDLETVALKCLEKDPARRYADATELAEELRRWREGEPIRARPPGPVSRALRWAARHVALTALAGGLLVAAIAFGAMRLREASSRRQEIARLLDRAEKAEDPAVAASLYEQIRGLAPGDPVVDRKAAEAHAAAERAAKRLEAERHLERGLASRTEHRRLTALLAELAAKRDALAETIEPHAAPAKKQPLWDVDLEMQKTRKLLATAYTETVSALTTALGVDPQNRPVQSALAEVYFEDLLRAELEGDLERMASLEKQVLALDAERYGETLAPLRPVALDSNPTGAEVYVFRYEEGPDRRLAARPYSPSSQSTREGGLEYGDYNRLGTTPIVSAGLPMGSYLLLLRKEGMRDVRYPLFIRRGMERVAQVRLYSEAEIGASFVYVPGGSFMQGGDREAALAEPLKTEAMADDFFIGRFEVTCDEYLAFLNDRDHHTVEQAARRMPREGMSSGYFWRVNEERIEMASDFAGCPVLAVSVDDATEYGRWMTERAKRAGERVHFRIPTATEWEKAARGVDGRPFPWGHHFDWTFFKGGRSRPGLMRMEKVGSFPQDESVYGVRDLAGGVCEMCEGAIREADSRLQVRGSAWILVYPQHARAASRTVLSSRTVNTATGFRLVRVLE